MHTIKRAQGPDDRRRMDDGYLTGPDKANKPATGSNRRACPNSYIHTFAVFAMLAVASAVPKGRSRDSHCKYCTHTGTNRDI